MKRVVKTTPDRSPAFWFSAFTLKWGRNSGYPHFIRTGKKKGPSVSAKSLILLPNLVGATRFELATPTMSR